MPNKIAIIDADLIGRTKHRFPNLACMKLSGYHKELGDEVKLKTNYNNLSSYDKVYVSKVFTDTKINEDILNLPNVEYGGTGFFYDKAQPLPYEIEHHMPDYHLYDEWVNERLNDGIDEDDEDKEKIIQNRRKNFVYYFDYSIGFLTRGCFRQCTFCVNKNYKQVCKHSQLEEFYDPTRKKICLLDDNFLGCPEWKEMLLELQATGKPFKFKQGLDERLLTDEKCKMLFNSNYDGDFTFAFDNIADYAIIEKKLQLLRKYTNKIPKFYVFCGFDRSNKWDSDFWKQDLWDIFRRIELLMKYKCLPYIMRFNRYIESPYKGMYITLARWCNQPSFFKKKSFREFVYFHKLDSGNEHSAIRYLKQIEYDIPELAEKFFDMKYEV